MVDDMRKLLDDFRLVEKKMRIMEEYGIDVDNMNVIPYDKDADSTMFDILDVCTKQVQASFKENPLVYNKKDNCAILTGYLPDLSKNIEFQFNNNGTEDDDLVQLYYYNNSNEDDVLLKINDKTLQKLNTLFGIAKNWKSDLNNGDIKPVKLKQNAND